jgi:organic radical activating enzyme
MRFKHLWDSGDEDKLVEETMKVVPHGSWRHPETGQPVILSLTGGEPTLRSKHLMSLLNHEAFNGLLYLLIETNCSVALDKEFIDALNTWVLKANGRKIIWSNSPKLSCSGESWEKAIRPSVAKQQILHWGTDQYFKFVCGASDRDFNEVAKAMAQYKAVGIHAPVYIMPMACTEEQQDEISAKVAHMCIDRGYIYCHRIHNSVFGNEIGT